MRNETGEGNWKRCSGSWKALLNGQAKAADVKRVQWVGLVFAGLGCFMVAVAVVGLVQCTGLLTGDTQVSASPA